VFLGARSGGKAVGCYLSKPPKCRHGNRKITKYYERADRTEQFKRTYKEYIMPLASATFRVYRRLPGRNPDCDLRIGIEKSACAYRRFGKVQSALVVG